MNLKRKCQIVMLPTEKADDIPFLKNINGRGNDLYKPTKRYYYTQSCLKNQQFEANHLYILSDEKIEEGDWFYYPKSYKNINLCNLRDYKYLTDKCNNNWLAESCKKIIASTDKSLNLPEPSPEFIQKYIEAYNSGNPIKEVMVKYEKICTHLPCKEFPQGLFASTLKTNKSNQISITKVKDSWSREEVSDLILKIVKEISYGNDYLLEHYSGDFKDAKKWISENL